MKTDKKTILQALQESFEMEKKENERNNKILEYIKQNVTKDIFDDILSSIKESQYTFDYEIIDEPEGDFQEVNYRSLEGEWVNQIVDGGVSEDEFIGTVCVKIDENEYFKFSYTI